MVSGLKHLGHISPTFIYYFVTYITYVLVLFSPAFLHVSPSHEYFCNLASIFSNFSNPTRFGARSLHINTPWGCINVPTNRAIPPLTHPTDRPAPHLPPGLRCCCTGEMCKAKRGRGGGVGTVCNGVQRCEGGVRAE